MPRRVLLYELNEVPWAVVDEYTQRRPESPLARLLGDSLQRTTMNEDPVSFQPWRTWPTFHTSMYTEDHNSYDLGQDPDTFRGTPMWDVADGAGRRVGLFGPLQSWPARRFRAGGFYVPDTFSRSPATEPPSLERFQALNLALTRENAFASDARLSVRRLAAAALDIAARGGITPWSTGKAGQHLVQERIDRRYKARRSIVQVLVGFDLFWRLHRRHRPDLSIFFTNHVAGMMHRYWGDWMPEYAESEVYRPDDVYRGFVGTAMEWFDHQVGRMRRWVDKHPDTVLVVASSMGQGPVRYRGDVAQTYVLDFPDQLIERLGLHGAELGLAMYPRLCLQFPSEDAARRAVEPIRSVSTELGPMFGDWHVHGTTVSFEIEFPRSATTLTRQVEFGDSQRRRVGDIAELGITTRPRLGGGNTAYHIPEGILIAYGGDIPVDPSREKVSVLDAAPSLLALMDLEPVASMQGSASIFAD